MKKAHKKLFDQIIAASKEINSHYGETKNWRIMTLAEKAEQQERDGYRFPVIKYFNHPDLDYPFQELYEMMNEFVGRSYDYTLEIQIRNALDCFIAAIKNLYHIVHEDEIKHFDIGISMGDNSFSVTPKNMFTACIMFDRYVPLLFLDNEEQIKFEDGSEIVLKDGCYIFIPIHLKINL